MAVGAFSPESRWEIGRVDGNRIVADSLTPDDEITLNGVIHIQSAKEQVRRVLEQLPDDATLSDIRHELSDSLYTLYVRQQIELGMQASREGRVTTHEDVKKRFLNGSR